MAMKNIDKLLFIPLFAALAAGCSSPVAFQTSEYDDVYYSSKDKTIIQDKTVASTTPEAPASKEVVTEENSVPNPEYSEKNSGTGNTYSNRDYANADDYYSDDYLYSSQLRRSYAPYRSGLSYYDLANTDYYWYNRNPYLYGRSAFYDPFYSYYDPFYSPYYDYGFRSPRIYTGLTVVIGRPYPYYGGYGGYYGGNPYYGGFNGGWYGGGYNNHYYANSGWYRNDTNSANKVQYGPRRERSGVPGDNAGNNNGARPRGDIGGVAPGGGGGVVAPGGGRGARPADADIRSTRSRSAGSDTAPGVDGARRNTTPDMARPEGDSQQPTRVGRQDRSIDRVGNEVDRAPAQPGLERPRRRNRVESTDYTPEQPARSMEERPSIRPRNDRNAEGYTPAPSQQQRRTEDIAPREQQREYQAPRMERQERSREMYRPEPSYQAPRQDRSYEAPRSYEPSSRPAPSSGGSNDGGGRSGRPRD